MPKALLLLLLPPFLAFGQIDTYQIYNSKEKVVRYTKLLRQAQDADVILFGEFHDNPIVHWLELELTESVLIDDLEQCANTLHSITQYGVRIALDDFGTGYSSLNYLRDFPFSILKIDRCFISSLIENNADQQLVNAAISLAHNLDLSVVAEGVETQGQYHFLKDIGCDFIQGYLFSKPDAVEHLIKPPNFK